MVSIFNLDMKMKLFFLTCVVFLINALQIATATAAAIQIIAFGGSNTFGKNLPRSNAYPAQLETLLKADGYDVIVVNQGTNGQTTADELSKIDSIISGNPSIVIFQPGGNDSKESNKHPIVTNTKDNIEKIVQRLVDHKILVIFSGGAKKRGFVEKFEIPTIDELSHLAPDDFQPDNEHLTAKGYGIVANKLLPVVEELLKKISSQSPK